MNVPDSPSLTTTLTEPSRMAPAIGAAPMVIETPLDPGAVLTRLEGAARRGKLAGFTHGSGEVLFSVSDFGTPFESVLEARRVDAAGLGGGTRMALRARIKPLWPIVFAVMLVLTIWPGVWLTDSLMRTYFPGYDVRTWIWYLPLTAPFCPWGFWSAIKRSRASARADLETMVPKIAGILDGRLEVGATEAGRE